MRTLLLLTAALCGFIHPVQAEEPKAQDIVTLESAGPMRDPAAGALEKTIWKDSKRSEIMKLLADMPPESPLRSLHDLKRRVLLSHTDAALIKNDVKPTDENNLFILRLKKLQEMGLYEDALKLYTDNIDMPHNARLAELGLTLMTHQRGLATACLEEKVIASQFPDDGFFTMMDTLCSFALGQIDEPPPLEDSPVLQAIMANEATKYSAQDRPTFIKMTPFELAVLKSEGHIDYTTFDTTPGALKNYPSRILMTFLDDKTLPGERLLPLQTEMAGRGFVSVKKLPAWKEAHIVKVDFLDKKKTDEKAANDAYWENIRPILTRENNMISLAPYGASLIEASPRAEGALLYKAIAVILVSGNDVPSQWCGKLASSDSDKSTVYYELLTFIRACEPLENKAVDNLESAWQAFPPENHGILWVLMGNLAPETSEYEDLRKIYEKQNPLTGQDDYVMHRQAERDETAENGAFPGFGLPLLHTLSAVRAQTGENMNPAGLQITVNSLLDEGLDYDARQIAREVLVGILANNKE